MKPAGTQQPATAVHVLAALAQFEAEYGPEAVTRVLGWAHDHLASRELDYETFAGWLTALYHGAADSAAP